MAMEGKSDMDRIGLFSEATYVSIGDKYVTTYNRPFNEAASKNRQLFPGGSKMMSGLQAGYFEPVFKRAFEKEAYSDPVRTKRLFRILESKKNVGKAFLPSNGEKLPSGLGSYYGTINGPVPYFSAELKGKAPYTAPGKNFYTNPGKKGTGYGYSGVTIGKPFEHSVENYDIGSDQRKTAMATHQKLLKGGPFRLNLYPREYFDLNPYYSDRPLPPVKKTDETGKEVKPFKPSSPGKDPGGMKAGTFDPFPAHAPDLYLGRIDKWGTAPKGTKVFHPPTVSKSRPIRSVMAAHVMKTLTPTNYKTVNVVSHV